MSETRKRKKGQSKSNSSDYIPGASDSSLIPKEPPRSTFSGVSSLKIISKVVIIFATLVVVYFRSDNETVKPLAKQSEIVEGRGQNVVCAADYVAEIKKFDGCVPKQCKRVVTDKVISKLEASALLIVAKKGLAVGGSSGGASVLNLHSGALSLGQHFSVKEKAKHAVAQAFNINPAKLFLADPTFFSEITSKKAVTIHDEYWHPHIDKETYEAFHYTTLLYLGDYNKDFEGGRFIFIDDKFNRTVEPRLGRLNMFTSGKENPHYVEKVVSGVRYALTIAFTCDKSKAIKESGTL